MRRRGLSTILLAALLVPVLAGMLALASAGMSATTRASLLEQKAVELDNYRRLEVLRAEKGPGGIVVSNHGPLDAEIVGLHVIEPSGAREDTVLDYDVKPGGTLVIPVTPPDGSSAYLVTGRGNIVPVNEEASAEAQKIFVEEQPVRSLPGVALSYTGLGDCYFALVNNTVLEEFCGDRVWWALYSGGRYAAVDQHRWVLDEGGTLYFYGDGYRLPYEYRYQAVAGWNAGIPGVGAYGGTPSLLNEGANNTLLFETAYTESWYLEDYYKLYHPTDYYVMMDTIDYGGVHGGGVVGKLTHGSWGVAAAYLDGVFAGAPAVFKASVGGEAYANVSLLYAVVGGGSRYVQLAMYPYAEWMDPNHNGQQSWYILAHNDAPAIALNPPRLYVEVDAYWAWHSGDDYDPGGVLERHAYLYDASAGQLREVDPLDYGSGAWFLSPSGSPVLLRARTAVNSTGAWLIVEGFDPGQDGSWQPVSNTTYRLPYLPLPGGKNWDYTRNSTAPVLGADESVARLPDGWAVLTSAGYYIVPQGTLLRPAAEPQDPYDHALLLPGPAAAYVVPTSQSGVYGLQEVAAP